MPQAPFGRGAPTESASLGLAAGVGRAGPSRSSSGLGLDGFTQPLGTSYHRSSKFTGHGFMHAPAVRYTARDLHHLEQAPSPVGQPPSPTEFRSTTPKLPRLYAPENRSPSVLERRRRARTDEDSLIRVSGFCIY